MVKLDKKELISISKLGGNNADLYIARITQEKIEEVKYIINNLKLQKGDDGKTPTDKELIDLIKPLIPEPIKGDDAEPITDEQLIELIKPLIPEIPEVIHGVDGKDYVLTSDDLKEIANLVDVEVPELVEKTPEEVRDLLENLEGEERLDISAIKGLDEKLKELKDNSGDRKIVGGGGNRLLKNLLDVNLSELDIVDNKYVLGSGTVKTIVAGKNITVDNTDIYNPIVNSLSDRYRTTSTDTNDIISTGQLTFTVDTDLAYIPNQDVLIDASSDNYMNGTVLSYNDITGELVVDIKHKHGSGTFSNWDINLDAITVSLDNYIQQEFETVSKNLKSFPSVLGYTADNLTSITYTTDTGTIIKTLNYTGDNLTSIVLSGDTPNGIDLTKTLSYVGDNLTNITYS